MGDEKVKRPVGLEEQARKKWVKYYCSNHQILLVGEGDFSFSLCLAHSFASAYNIVASSLDSYDDVINKYKDGKSNLQNLKNLGACLLPGVDATKMKLHSDLRMRRFDRIIFNFPHAGFYGKEDNPHLIEMHKDLVLGFLMNARNLLGANGEIHVNHKIGVPYNKWNIEELASQSLLLLSECVKFKKKDYPGYHNKRGHGLRCDEPFNLGKCCTFKFICNPRDKKENMVGKQIQERKQPFQENQVGVERLPTPVIILKPITTPVINLKQITTPVTSLKQITTPVTNLKQITIRESKKDCVSERKQTFQENQVGVERLPIINLKTNHNTQIKEGLCFCSVISSRNEHSPIYGSNSSNEAESATLDSGYPGYRMRLHFERFLRAIAILVKIYVYFCLFFLFIFVFLNQFS